MEDIHGPNKTDVNGIGGRNLILLSGSLLTMLAWSEKGIVGRGVLVDFHAYTQANNITYHPFDNSNVITLSDLKACLAHQGTELQFGDILLIRSGYTAEYNNKTAEELTELTTKSMPPGLAGVEQSEDVLKWIWENFAAVAGDHPSFERWRKWFA
jgi:hypothetical protein